MPTSGCLNLETTLFGCDRSFVTDEVVLLDERLSGFWDYKWILDKEIQYVLIRLPLAPFIRFYM